MLLKVVSVLWIHSEHVVFFPGMPFKKFMGVI